MGCDAWASMLGHRTSNDNGPDILSGCVSFCSFASDEDTDVGHVDHRGRDREGHSRRRNPNDKYCHGMGCCQTHISQDSTGGMPKQLSVGWLGKQSAFAGNTMSRALVFVAAEGWYDNLAFSGVLGPDKQPDKQQSARAVQEVPIILQWEILSDKPNCTTSNKCKSKHSHCKQGNRGYTCHCEVGYDGNPYSDDDGQGCKAPDAGRQRSMIIVSVGAGLASAGGLIVSVLAGWFISSKVKQRNAQISKRKFFDQNRGQLLQQLVSQRADIAERMIIPLEEIEKATNNFDKARELGGGGHGTVYKGILSDLHVVAIKKPKKIIQREIDEFINEVAILSQINHRNVVKLYGCCLETEVPMLVYEFISNGTLYDHLHINGPRSLSWEDRLRIAVETAKSLAYLHSTASMPIIHRDVKSVNILLDDTLTAKVADFGASRYISVEKSGLTTMVQGTIGYLDPMYFYTGRLTDKSDVYSYGVMLIELLTRQKPFSYLSSEGEGLVTHFVALFEEGNLSQILDPQITDEGGKEVEEAVALAVACIKLRGEERPTMRQVELTLEGLRPSKEYISDEFGTNRLENKGVTINAPSTVDGRSTDGSTRQYSMEEELAMSSRYPR
ncbi:putative wall-associated receptor kinase-like 16 [Triticum dicoccoides]|uniref:putative wall-associated receptor kinase-like 16 n=1 Tax=Triticum dicoccoides TaxID=85692 RepID=UPI00188F77A1|nr:putative wall-associated receptor kinase-like 16 [Triticum dicoccoides]